jgi:hypothetical protein
VLCSPTIYTESQIYKSSVEILQYGGINTATTKLITGEPKRNLGSRRGEDHARHWRFRVTFLRSIRHAIPLAPAAAPPPRHRPNSGTRGSRFSAWQEDAGVLGLGGRRSWTRFVASAAARRVATGCGGG